MTVTKAEVIFTVLAACIRKLALRVDRANCMAARKRDELIAAGPQIQGGAAAKLGVALQSNELRGSKALDALFSAIAQERSDAVLIIEDALTFQYRKQIIDFTIPAVLRRRCWGSSSPTLECGHKNSPTLVPSRMIPEFIRTGRR
jgi:hypothetical protein